MEEKKKTQAKRPASKKSTTKKKTTASKPKTTSSKSNVKKKTAPKTKSTKTKTAAKTKTTAKAKTTKSKQTKKPQAAKPKAVVKPQTVVEPKVVEKNDEVKLSSKKDDNNQIIKKEKLAKIKKSLRKLKIFSNKKLLYVAEALILLIIFFVVLGLALSKPKTKVKVNIGKQIFKVVDRTSNIKKYKKDQDYTIVGWIRIQGTNIDYPVLFYDNAPISDVRQNIGWTYRNVKKLDDRTVIEGHNIMNMSSNPKVADKDSKRFEQLLSFWDPKFVENNKYIQYTLNDKDYVFKIYGVSFADSEVYYIQNSFTQEEKKAYIEKVKSQSLFDFDVDVKDTDKLISIYTCTRFYGYSRSVAFRVDGRLLRDGEKNKNYSFEKNQNYETAKSYSDTKNANKEVSS